MLNLGQPWDGAQLGLITPSASPIRLAPFA